MMNYEEIYDELEKSQELLVKMIKQLNMKSDLTPQEVCNLKEAVEVMEKIVKFEDKLDESMDEEDEYSERMYDDRSYRGMSRARGRSPRTGRFVSRFDGNQRHNRDMDGRMSGHSIEDRMVDSLQKQMDYAETDYERQKINEEIQRIRQGMK